MGVFGKKSKEAAAPQPPIPQGAQADAARENVLSAWAIEPLMQKQGAAQIDAAKSERRGYVICRKCFEVIAAQDIKCSNCGAANNRN